MPEILEHDAEKWEGDFGPCLAQTIGIDQFHDLRAIAPKVAVNQRQKRRIAKKVPQRGGTNLHKAALATDCGQKSVPADDLLLLRWEIRVNDRKKSGEEPISTSDAAAMSTTGDKDPMNTTEAPDMDDASSIDEHSPGTMHAGLPPKLQSHIGRHLQAMYDEVAQEPVPDRLLNLLQELERKEQNG